jgi:serine/threonine protein kinase/Tfp pilus assembly protein PilF
MKCLECGAENVVDAKFCKTCGERLDPAPSRDITLVSKKLTMSNRFIKNRFKVIKKLGKGGMGEVFLAEDIKLKRKVAVKSILTQTLSDTSSKARFLREAQTASQLDHPNICTIYEIYEEDDCDYIVMQYIDGITIDQITKLKPLSINKVLDIAIQVCEGMIEAHGKEIIHRDIKPGNIMVDKNGVVKILDFGLAKFGGESASKRNGAADSNLTEKGVVLGTAPYLSPEQASGKPLDQRTDIFSFGILLYEMLEGENPFKEEEQISTLYNVLNKEVEFHREIPGELKEIICKTLEKDKKKRYSSFSQLKDDLDQFRSNYAKLKEPQVAEGGTEIIDYREQEKLLKELQKSSDNEELGDLVYRIKKFKASTERVHSNRRRKIKFLLIPAVLILVLAAALFLTRKTSTSWVKEGEKFYIYLHNFENKTGENSLSEMIDHLLVEALNQFDEFKTINKGTALSITGKEDKKVDLMVLKDKFNITCELTGTISKEKNSYIIDAQLKTIGKKSESYNITASGNYRDSLLRSQVDLLARRVYLKFFRHKEKDLEIKKVTRIFGGDWDQFSQFYAGLRFFKKVEYKKAAHYFLKSQDLLISKYYLAKIYDFDGDRNKSLNLVKTILLKASMLTPSLRLKVQALNARLNFLYTEAIQNLEQLKNEFQFSKEAFFELGEAYFHHADPIQAKKYYEQALALDEHYSEAINHLGYCHSYIGEHNKAIELFEDYRRLDQTANSFDSLGDGYFYQGYLQDAEEMKKSAVSVEDDKIAYPYQSLADIYILKDQYQQADEALQEYERLEPTKQAKAYVMAKRAFIQYKNRQYESALALIDQSLETFDPKDINENNAEAHWLKGLILLKLNKVAESKVQLEWLRVFKDQYRLDRDNFNSSFKYFIHLEALIEEKENQMDKADERFRYLIDMKNKLSYWITYYYYQFFHTEYAKYLSRNQRYKEALEELDKCLEFNNGRYIPALWIKAEILEKLNDDERFEIYNKIDELYGESTEKNYLRDLLKKKLDK